MADRKVINMHSELETYERLFTSDELVEVLGCSESTIEAAVRRKLLKVRSRFMGRRVFAAEDIFNWINTRRRGGTRTPIDDMTKEEFIKRCKECGIDIERK